MNREKRTDRILIAIALLILMLSGGAFYFDDLLFGGRRGSADRIGIINSKSGDVRLKFADDLKWGRASRGQDVIYNDAVFVGENSKAELLLGETQLAINENTMVVLRRDRDTNFMNLNYGTLLGRVAKNEKVIVDTGVGKPLELTTKTDVQIVLRKKDGRTELSVLNGEAKVVVDGRSSTIDKSSRLIVDEKSPSAKVEAIRIEALAPRKEEIFYAKGGIEVPFRWEWSHGRDPLPSDKFTVQFSAEPSFIKLHAEKSVRGKSETTLQMSKTLSLYYRIRGPRGELSQTEKVNFVRVDKPVIVKPFAQQIYATPMGQNAMLDFEFEKQSARKLSYQVATDREFTNVVTEQAINSTTAVQELPLGDYFLRARSEYTPEQISDWCDPVGFRVEGKIEQIHMAQLPPSHRILIPNRPYPAQVYNSGDDQIAAYLHDMGFMRDYFPLAAGTFDKLNMKFTKPSAQVSQSGRNWPKQFLKPGQYQYKYQLTKSGYQPSPVSEEKNLEIAMEPPRPLGAPQWSEADKKGMRETKWAFTPLLFAKSYDVEIAKNPSFVGAKQIRTDQPIAIAKLSSGMHYWRMRARDANGEIISDFSAPRKAAIPDGLPPVLAKVEPEPEYREPAANENVAAADTISTKIEENPEEKWEQSGWWAWLGSGMNYVDYRQSVPGRGTLTSQSPKGPSQYVEGGYISKGGLGGIMSYKNTPGEIIVDNATIDNGAYNWSTFSIEALGRRLSGFSRPDNKIYYGARIGVQQHKTPFVFLDADANLQLKTNQMNTASLGVLGEWFRRRWSYHWLVRYQFPFSSQAEGSNQFSITPTFAFDGSIGTSYYFTEQLKAGLFWYGQWHQYNFIYGDDQVTNEGFQSLFYSNIDLRLGFDF